MNLLISEDHLAQRLESAVGVGAVESDGQKLASYSVDGKKTTLLCLPDSAEKVAAALRICSEADATVVPWGGGTAIVVGNPPQQVDVVIGLDRLNRLVEHDDANLTATVEAGMTLTNVQEIVARRNQFLPCDPPFPARATVGGLVATNLNGPRRSCYGSVRDLVIGMKVALASGAQIKAGGKVVKNVAGYDMCKLFVGSLGTLGIMTEVTLRMAPIPERAATLIASGTLPQALQLADELSRSPLLPAAVFFLNSQANEGTDVARKDWQVAIWSEGFEETVARHLREARAMAERSGLSAVSLHDKTHSRLWDEIGDFPLHADRLVYRVTVPRGSIAEFIETVQGWETTDFLPGIVSDFAAGTVWIASKANKASGEQFPKLISLARDHGGHAVMLAAPPNLKEGIDVWGSSPRSLSLMQEIKHQFDPKGLLNPGRFVSGI